jgi:hypothetical protein
MKTYGLQHELDRFTPMTMSIIITNETKALTGSSPENQTETSKISNNISRYTI